LFTLNNAFADEWLEDMSGWQIGVLGNFPARRSLSRSTSRLG